MAGTALLMAVVAVLAVALGAILRRTAAAVTVGIVAVVLPYVIGIGSVLPVSAAQWLLRLSPAAGFAVEQSIPAYPQVSQLLLPGLRLLPARAVGRVRGAVRLDRAGFRPGCDPHPPARRMKDALRAEWAKQRTVAVTGWLLLATAALTALLSVAAAAATRARPRAAAGTRPGSA